MVAVPTETGRIMAYLMQKAAAALFAVWGLFVVSGANVGFYRPQPSEPVSPSAQIYEGYEAPVEANTPALPVAVPVTTTTVTTIANCGDVVRLGAALGWPETELATLRTIANAESRCSPWAHNYEDPHGGSYGLLQINGFWCLPNANWPIGWLQEKGIVSNCDDLYSATANLLAGLAIWHETGWQAWSTFSGE
jgi:hypothetical protein